MAGIGVTTGAWLAAQTGIPTDANQAQHSNLGIWNAHRLNLFFMAYSFRKGLARRPRVAET
jgi:hypothetical protein